MKKCRYCGHIYGSCTMHMSLVAQGALNSYLGQDSARLASTSASSDCLFY